MDGVLQAIPSNTSRGKEPSADARGSSAVSTADGGSDAGDDGTKRYSIRLYHGLTSCSKLTSYHFI